MTSCIELVWLLSASKCTLSLCTSVESKMAKQAPAAACSSVTRDRQWLTTGSLDIAGGQIDTAPCAVVARSTRTLPGHVPPDAPTVTWHRLLEAHSIIIIIIVVVVIIIKMYSLELIYHWIQCSGTLHSNSDKCQLYVIFLSFVCDSLTYTVFHN